MINVEECAHWRLDVLSTERHPKGDRVVAAWLSLCDAEDRSLGAVELHEAAGHPVYGALYADLGRMAEVATAGWPVAGEWGLPVDDGRVTFVDHRTTPEGKCFEVVAESVRFPLADLAALPEPAMAAAA